MQQQAGGRQAGSNVAVARINLRAEPRDVTHVYCMHLKEKNRILQPGTKRLMTKNFEFPQNFYPNEYCTVDWQS